MNNIMLDIETLGTTMGSVITQVGAVFFDKKTGELGKEFKINIDLDDSLRYDFKIDGDTLKWWFGQPKEAQLSFLQNPIPSTVPIALHKLSEFVGTDNFIWSHAGFDLPQLETAYKMLFLKSPFRASE